MDQHYIAYLRTDHWKLLRRDAMARWGDRCLNCAVPKVDIHHLRYGTLYDVTTDDLMPLCRRCHDAVHQSSRLRRVIASDQTSQIKRQTILGFLAGRDEALTKIPVRQTGAEERDEWKFVERRFREQQQIANFFKMTIRHVRQLNADQIMALQQRMSTYRRQQRQRTRAERKSFADKSKFNE